MEPIRIGILTISDRAASGEYVDKSGPMLQQMARDRLHGQLVLVDTVPDERAIIRDRLIEWVDSESVDLILTTGGTGFTPRDVTPEATKEVIYKEAPGLAEAMRLASLQVTPHAMLSRAIAGIRQQTLIVNLPGSPKAARENLEAILPAIPHAIELLTGKGTDASHQHRTGKRSI
jgi:molybdenum cofactor synthesis domain-containing protein